MKKILLPTGFEDIVHIGLGASLVDVFTKMTESRKVIFISDEKIWKNCQKFFPQDFQQKFTKFLLLKNPKADDKNLKIIEKNLKNAEFILALGSGVISDLSKFSSAQSKIPYAIFASATSMNGYLSKNASITISGYKKTLPATLPQKVFCNLDILKSAPLELTKAGIGDSLCFYSCWFDWYLSHKILGTKFDKNTFEILQPKMDFLVKNYQKFSLKDEKFLALLIEILLLSGIAMTMADGSYPASQSEHMIAHTIDMKYPKKSEKLLHGQVIAVTSLTSAFLQEYLLDVLSRHENEVTLESVFLYQKNIDGFSPRLHGEVKKFFKSKIASACLKEYEEKYLLMKKAKKLNQKDIKELQKIHLSASKLREIFSHFKIKFSVKSLGLLDEEYQDCVAMAKFTRKRFTCLDLAIKNVA